MIDAEKRLLDLYKRWYSEIKNNQPDLLKGNDYSCPYYVGIPEGWFKSDARILIVAENGFGYYGNGKDEGIIPSDFKTLQEINLGELPKAVGNPDEGEHPFWTRTRNICKYGFPVAWTAIDKICIRRDRKSKLSDAEREKLHSVGTRVLAEEISILDPTIVLFFGWHEASLQHELPELYEEMYPNGRGDDSKWKNSIVTIEKDRTYIFTYNPHNPYWKDKPADYEKNVVQEFEKHVSGKKIPKKRAIDNQDPLLKHEAKMTVIYMLLFILVISLIIIGITYVIDPVFGKISFAAFSTLMFMMLITSGYTYKKTLKSLQEEAAKANKNKSIPAKKTENAAKQSDAEAILDNPVVKVAASYALGKAVIEASKKTDSYQKNHRNPNADRYKQAQQQANYWASTKYAMDEKTCATCAYWSGDRKTVSSGGKTCVQIPRNSSGKKCEKMHMSIQVMRKNCGNWKKM